MAIRTSIPQVIGDRIVENPLGKVADVGGPVWLSLETCSCGYSTACQGVGYRDEIQQANVCKKCGEPHTPFVTEEEYREDQNNRLRNIILIKGIDSKGYVT